MRPGLMLAMAACSNLPLSPPTSEDGSSTQASSDVLLAADPSSEWGPLGLDPEDDLSGLDGISCATGSQCAEDRVGDWLGDTCCAFGEPLERVDHVDYYIEGIDIELRDDVVAACSGFGPWVGRVATDGTLVGTPSYYTVRRCQRAAIGPETPDGDRWFYFSNHGDTFLQAALFTMRTQGNGEPELVSTVREPGVLYAGLALFDEHLWVAAHEGGLRVYRLGEDGTPVFQTVLDGFGNAGRIVVDGRHAYVTDLDGVHVLSALDPENPVRLGVVPTAGKPRDIELDATHVFVPLGGDGLQVFERRGDTLMPERVLDLDGSIQGVAVDGDYVAVAAWDHLALLERDGLDRIGGAELRFEFEQTWAVAMTGNRVLALEWFGMHSLRIRPGYVAPEVAAEAEVVTFDGTRAGRANVWLQNRGPLQAVLGEATTDFDSFQVSVSESRIPPGGRVPVQVRYAPPAHESWTNPRLSVQTNDPGRDESPFRVTLSARDSDELDIGDRIGKPFGFLDPSGDGRVEGLLGQVTILAYFELF